MSILKKIIISVLLGLLLQLVLTIILVTSWHFANESAINAMQDGDILSGKFLGFEFYSYELTSNSTEQSINSTFPLMFWPIFSVITYIILSIKNRKSISK